MLSDASDSLGDGLDCDHLGCRHSNALYSAPFDLFGTEDSTLG